MPEVASTELLYRDYYSTFRRTITSNRKVGGKTVLANYTTFNLTSNSRKVITIVKSKQTDLEILQ